MKRIAQRFHELGDCGIACAAMLSGRGYKDAHRAALALGLRTRHGDFYTYHHHLEKLLKKLGCKSIARKRFISFPTVAAPAILKVNVRNAGQSWHWVVMYVNKKGERVILDPQPGKPARIVSFRGYKGAGYYLTIVRNGG